MSARDALYHRLSQVKGEDRDALLDAYRDEVLRQAARRLRDVVSSDEGSSWDWWDAATIPTACAALIDPTTTEEP